MIQWTGNNLQVIDFTGKSPRFGEWFKSWDEFESYVHSHGDILKLFSEDGSHFEVPVGAWIVKTPDGHNVPSVARFIHAKQEQPKTDRKSPFTGGKVTIHSKEEETIFRGEKVKIISQYYRCEDTGREFTDQKLDDDMMWAIFRAYCEKKGITSFNDIILKPEHPEVDLEKEIESSIRFLNGHHTLENGERWYKGRYEELRYFARYFYGLRNRALEEAARHVYESWMGGTMDDVRRDMVELGKVLKARKEE